MDVIIAIEHRFQRTPDGVTWTSTGLPHAHWARYLGAFDRVRVLARVEPVADADRRWQRVDGDRVEVAAVPAYVGPAAYVRRAAEVRRAIRSAVLRGDADAAILRMPGTIATVAAAALRGAGRPFAVEVTADPHELFAPRSIDHPLRPLFRWALTRELRRVCAQASAALYVASVLHARYPPAPAAPAFDASDVELSDDAFARAPRTPAPPGAPFRVLTVGSLEQLYKAPDVLVDALARVVASGLDVQLTVVGDGRRRAEVEALARDHGVVERIRFTGRIPSGAAVRAELDRADLFVLPSRTEGMPRALLEAMARGLPCLATPVGGIPELLPEAALVRPEAASLASRIRELARDPVRRAALARANLARARAFHEERLRPIRSAFLAALSAATARAAALRAGRSPAWA